MKLMHGVLVLAFLATAPRGLAQINPGGGDPDGDNPGGGGGAGTDTLLFSTTGSGYDATVSGIGMFLDHLTRRDIGVITPAAGASAETFLDHANYNLMHGDKDVDGIWFDPLLGDAIDAITVCGDATLAKFPRFSNVFISVKANIGIPGLTAVMTPGDVASPRLGGTYSYLITEAQIRTAFNIPAGQLVDVDAVEKADDGTIYLSLENDILIRGGAVMALDGDMLMIRAADLAYNGCQAIAVTPGAGTIAVFEGTWDNMVVTSGVANSAGVPVFVIGDLDALAFDDLTVPMWMSQGLDGPELLPHFLFSGDTLDGAAVLSTQTGGSIATMNGQALASAFPMPTTGTQMGLLPGAVPVVHPIGNLCRLDHAPVRVVADVDPALPAAGATIHVEWNGCDAGAATLLALQVGAVAAGGAVPGAGVTNPGFGFWFGGVAPLFVGPYAAGADGHGALTVVVAGAPAGIFVSLQPVTPKAGFGAVVMGAPVLMQF